MTSTCGVWINAGSRFETPETNGTAHFLEHMVFKGSSGFNQTELELKVENSGAHLNAYTSRESTVFYSKQMSKDTIPMLETVGEMILNPKLDPVAVENERHVILREHEEVSDQVEEVVFDRLHENCFDGHPLGMTILGPTENILSITPKNLRDYIDSHYTPDRLVIVAAGEVNHDEIVAAAEKISDKLIPKERAPLEAINMDKPSFIGSDVRIRNDDDQLCHLAIAFESRSGDSQDNVALMLMQVLLGEWNFGSLVGMNHLSKLCNKAAEEDLARRISAFNTSYSDTGLFGVYAVAEPTALQDLTWYIMDSFVNLTYKTTEEQLHVAKTQLLATYMAQMDGSYPVCEDIGRQMLAYGRRITPAEMFNRINSVTLAELHSVAFDVINDRELVCSTVGANYELPDYNWLRRRTYWNRY